MLSQQWKKLIDVTCDFCGICFSNRFLVFPLSKSRILSNLEILLFWRYFAKVKILFTFAIFAEFATFLILVSFKFFLLKLRKQFASKIDPGHKQWSMEIGHSCMR